MKTLDSLLQNNKAFEPSLQVKNLILNSIKKPQNIAIGAGNYEIPGFISYDTRKYNHFTMLVVILYALEIFAAVSIVLTTTTAFYMIIKLIAVVILLFLDMVVAKHSRSKDDDKNSTVFRKTFLLLLRDFFMEKLSTGERTKIQSNLKECDSGLDKISRFSKNMLVLLYVFGLIKVVVFYLDYFLGGVDWSIIFSKDPGFLIFFFGAPVAYLTIPMLAWQYYGKWIWTGIANKHLEKEVENFNLEINNAEISGVGIIDNCINLNQNRPITLGAFIQDLTKMLEQDNPSSPSTSNKHDNIDVTEGKGNSWRIKKQSGNYLIDFFGILADSELLQIVSLQNDISSRRLLLLICMLNQIMQSQSPSKNGVLKKEYEEILKSIY
jgi:hypothetical protein